MNEDSWEKRAITSCSEDVKLEEFTYCNVILPSFLPLILEADKTQILSVPTMIIIG